MRWVEAKGILSARSNGDGWFGSNYGMNIYRGCCHGCIYCDSRSECYQVDNFDQVRAKEDALLILERELRSKRKKGIIATGAMSDPYNPFEAKYQLTRGSLELINRYGYGASLLTKSDLVVRDIDLFRKIKEHSPMVIKLTITTYDDRLCQMIEPHVTLSSKRFATLQQVSQVGVLTGIHLFPILPFINDTEENVRLIIREAAESGAKFVYPSIFGVTLRQNQRIYFYQQLDKFFPGIRKRYIQTFGNSYECISPNQNRLYQVLVDECNKYGLLYDLPTIRKTIREGYEQEQISLF